jgi:hypothetical protein
VILLWKWAVFFEDCCILGVWYRLFSFQPMASGKRPEQNEHWKHIRIHEEIYQYNFDPAGLRLFSDPILHESHINRIFWTASGAKTAS